MKIKLIIWDLDDTLWTGTLAENNEVVLKQNRADVIIALNNCGIVSAISSKNNFDDAKNKLIELGLWDQFVFRRISFNPKGESVKRIIEDMNLQPKHVLFIDDNHMNLMEVKHLLPDINVLDSTKEECDQELQKIFEENRHISKSRVEEYRILDQKIDDHEQSGLPREDFLKSCEIRVCIVTRMDNLDFTIRIEELINRTNQLNFLKTRVEEGSMAQYISDLTRNETYSIFVWDKYGYHGLVGFAAVVNGTHLAHFTFSCRIMHMGIEEWFLSRLQDLHPKLVVKELPVTPSPGSWLKEEKFHTPAVRKNILQRETDRNDHPTLLRIMANCQSGALAHFSGLGNVVDFDNMPRFFVLSMMLNDLYKQQEYPAYLVYGPFSDYWDIYWPENSRGETFLGTFEACARKFCEFLSSRNTKMLILLPPENADEKKYLGVSRELIVACNTVWRNLAKENSALSLMEVSKIAEAHEVIEARHFEVSLLQKIALQIADWFEEVSNCRKFV